MTLHQVSPFEATNFDENTIHVFRNGFPIEKYLGVGHISDAQIAALAGAPTGHSVHVTTISGEQWSRMPDGDRGRPGMYLLVTGPWVEPGQRHLVGMIKRGKQKSLYIKDIFFTDSAPKNLARAMVKRMVRTATTLHFHNLQLLAAGGRKCSGIAGKPGKRYGGFYIWPQCGFDMPLDKANLEIVQYFPYYPARLSACRSVQDVLALEGGQDYWKVNGDGNFMTFTLKSNRAERKLLSKQP